MKKKTLYNLVMVVIIAAIMTGGVLCVGRIKGWFDSADGGPVLVDIVGVVRMERSGVNYTVEQDTVLRPGDVISTQMGATVGISVGGNYITLGGGTELTITDVENLEVHLTAGELFVNAEDPLSITFKTEAEQLDHNQVVRLSADSDSKQGLVQLRVADATVAISYRQGAQTLSVFRGEVDDVSAGQAKEYVGGKTYISEIKIDSLNSFMIAQIRKANKKVDLSVSNEDLDELEEKRRQELEGVIGGVTEPTIPTHEHNFEPTYVPATCTESGYIEYRCNCGESYQDNKTEPKGHIFGEWVVKKEATSEEEGLMERKCTNCDEKEQKVIQKLPETHVHDYEKEVVAPTCTEKGYTLFICACGNSYKDNETAATGHQYSGTVIPPQCTTQGYTLYTCTCGDSYIDDFTSATGHNWGEWIVVKEATEEEEGKKERTCSDCDEREEADIPKIDNQKYVYISIYCNTILDNMADLKPGKAEFVPIDGVILPTIKVAFTEGETVFDILKRICDEKNIQLEYSWSMYGTYYIEGINNLYEFDCGGDSGWMYKVNGWFPNYGVSAYEVSDGDQIFFLYTCKGLGTDVGAPEWEGD